jgi:alkanesulfonate monooxygenase SsuD/methylene tetrahydromethanopterin reductase-like flavin-dependent oxidoreductase (luciferase family)
LGIGVGWFELEHQQLGFEFGSVIGEARGDRAVSGSAEQLADEISRRVLDVGIDGVIVNLPTHRYTPGVITKVGEALKPLTSP